MRIYDNIRELDFGEDYVLIANDSNISIVHQDRFDSDISFLEAMAEITNEPNFSTLLFHAFLDVLQYPLG